ncbi:MAG: RidA family protein [Nitrospira sp.]|nr:RidA family protein [Nitrospira sp.]MCB9711216.1 RidA family protein [Nitrospiraceae bacterium]MDR4486777.1 RidA family protein [Nitrospirales bacterium]MCA9464423.1 RidA family protein [Nitrospira sp.]MCA9475684.1 RidA family protein [Nitrospira sp.]
MTIHDQLDRLGVTLPAAPRPVGSYVPAKQAGDLVFVSGVLPFQDGKIFRPGKLGGALTVADGVEAAKLALLNALAIVQQAVGSLDRIKSIVRMTGHVASAEGFVEQPAVLNGASDLLVDIFGDSGRHARLALGAAELPLHAAVELELIVQINPEL